MGDNFDNTGIGGASVASESASSGELRTENLRPQDLPDDAFDRIADQVANFTVGMLRLVRKEAGERLISIGTGTLVVAGGKHGILTAEHVLAALHRDDQLALILDFKGKLSRVVFDLKNLDILPLARGREDARGPDIGFIVFSPYDVGRLNAQKSFFNVDKRRGRFSEGYLDSQEGLWFSVGIVEEFEEELPRRQGFSSIKGMQALCGASTRPRARDDGEFDYLEIDVGGLSEQAEIPQTSFGGMSGGGIWHVPLRKTAQGTIEATELILSGVIFYETGKVNDARTLRGHGRRTVYEYVPAKV